MSRRERDNERLYNAIEGVMGAMHRKEPPDEMMRMIRTHYPSPVFFLESNAYSLRKAGLPRLDAFYFSIIPALTRRVMRESFGQRARLNHVSIMAEYLKTLYIGIHVECFYVVLLDARGCRIETVLIRKGNTDTAPFELKEMLSIAVQKEAKAIVMSHNHPCGTLKPSREDVTCTLRALNATMSLGVPILDHIIIGHGRAVSMRDLGVIPTQLWAMQAPRMKLVREWIDVDLLEQQALQDEQEQLED